MVSLPPLSGAPSVLRRPMTRSWWPTGSFSQSSSSIRIRRTTAYEPPSSHACGVPGAAGTNTRRPKSSSAGFGLPVPSIWPIRLRAVIGRAVAPGCG